MMKTDVIIVGSGIVGLVLAHALARSTSLSICILEAQTALPVWSHERYHHRVSAISLASQHILQSLDIWNDVKAKRISPFTDIFVWDGAGKGEIQFRSQDIAEAVLGYIIENNAIHATLLEKLSHYPNVSIKTGVSLKTVMIENNQCRCEMQNEEFIDAKLIVGADGGNSWLRKQMKVESIVTDYQQQAIVAMVETQEPHQKMARQVFLPSGPLAFLPLNKPCLSSIVWSLPSHRASELMALDKASFENELSVAFDRLGQITQSEPRFTFPLTAAHSDRYVLDRVALIGDAAHTIHPLAGQGLNLGMEDAMVLADVIKEAIINKRDYGSYHVLRKYERKQRTQNKLMLQSVDGLKSLFASNSKSLQFIRSLGLNCIDHTAWAKNIFSRYASQGFDR